MTNLLKRRAIPLLLAACLGSAFANAGELTYQGVTFTSSFVGNLLTIEIDAANPLGDWSSATTIGAIGIKDVGTFDSVVMTSGPGTATSWTLNNMELSAGGCASGGNDKTLCAYGSHVSLADNMVFTFQFTGGTQDFTSPHLKVNFFEGDATSKVGSLLSQNIAPVPEPSSYLALLGGLGILAAYAHRKTVNERKDLQLGDVMPA